VGSRVAVLASGKGSNLQALLDDPAVRPMVALVLTDRPGVEALVRAEEAGVDAVVVDWNDFPDRPAFGRGVQDVLEREGIDYVVLAGFMRILPPEQIRRYEGRVINTHPALLPSFPGAHPVRDTLAWGAKVTGVTVHFVDEEVDHGPIVLQEAVPVLPDDDEASLHERLKAVEHRLLPLAVRLLAEGRIRVEGRTVHVQADD
jgi:phosphoribosylglycinamide formyltransferase-1